MELFNVVLVCVAAGLGGIAAMEESEVAMREHVLGGGGGSATANERNRYEAITINKPVVRFGYQPAPGDVQDDRHVRQFQDDITGAPSPSVRCFCNLPACISTGYMCKSHFGGCFSDLFQQHPPASASKTAYRGRHGCIEMLTDKAQRERCQRLPNGNRYPAAARTGPFKSNDYDHPRSLVHCCHEDMCNHADNPQTKDLINDTTLGDLDGSRVIGSQLNTGYTDSDVWFKAATIAVPICGAVILFVLIALAIRLLKTESLNNTSHKLGCSYHYGKHGHNCVKHHDQPYCQPVAAEPFLRKDPIIREHADLVYPLPRRTLPAPITLTKNINERLNSSNANSNKQYNYNLLPMRNKNDIRVHEMVPKCYDNKLSTAFASPSPNSSQTLVTCDENPASLHFNFNSKRCTEEHGDWKLNNLDGTDACDMSKNNDAHLSPQA